MKSKDMFPESLSGLLVEAGLFVKTKFIIGILACFFAIGTVISICGADTNVTMDMQASSNDPLNAAYTVEGQAVQLIGGRSETEAAPGSALKNITSVFGQPVYGNLDGDTGVDAALILTCDHGGSGTFYYIAAARNMNGSYHGTRAILLGDRVAPQNSMIRNGVIIVNYADRRSGEPLTASPSLGKSKYLFLEGDELTETAPVTEGETVFQGWVVIGHEVRSFTPCLTGGALWLPGDSPALTQIMAAYRSGLPEPLPYAPLFMTLVGKTAGPVSDGFGADYDGSFFATQLICVFPQGNCKSDMIYVQTPLPGERVLSPLIIRGYARGNWFFEGDFPVVLSDRAGKLITQGVASARSPWMTDRFVPFEATVKFNPPGGLRAGVLVLKKNNPTDRPELDDSLEIPIFFGTIQ